MLKTLNGGVGGIFIQINLSERFILEYYVIYDKDDNLVAYCENIDELSKFVNRRRRELKYRFKNKNIFNIEVPSLLKIYKFS